MRRTKEANPNALYCCDPVMGHPDKGCIVPEGVSDFFRDHALGVRSLRECGQRHGRRVSASSLLMIFTPSLSLPSAAAFSWRGPWVGGCLVLRACSVP